MSYRLQVDQKEATILRVLDGLWESHEWVPANLLEEKVHINPRRVRAMVRGLENRGWVEWVSSGKMGEPSIKLKETGKDALAVWDLIKQGVIDDLGHVVGEGKESVVVLAFKDDRKVALKFHRYYSGEFTRIKDSLAYAAIEAWRKRTFGRVSKDNRPIVIERAKAQIEYWALGKLEGKVKVPRPLGINRHVVAMEFLGDDLTAPLMSKFKKGKDQVEGRKLVDEIVKEYEKAVKMGVVHGDMSEYNVVVWKGMPWMIDWPQALPQNADGADALLERDREKLKRLSEKFS
ncbi:MAG TPA: hypothetical protein ENN60_02390 [archaeon]|nr:hypothetical protein [archaeon]